MNKQVRRRNIRRAEEMEESFMKYNFDEVIDRKGTHAMKVERLPKGADKIPSPSGWQIWTLPAQNRS